MVLAATDPAQPYGASLHWPRPPSREDDEDAAAAGAARAASPAPSSCSATASRSSTSSAAARACCASRASRATQLGEALAAIVEAVGERRLPRLGLERIDGESIVGHELEAALVEAGFERQPRRLVAAA